MFSVGELCTLLHALRFYCHKNVECADEAALSEKVMEMAEAAKRAETAKRNDLPQQKV